MDSLNSVARGQDRRLCANGCGFYGSAATLCFCSECYREHKFASNMNAAIDNNTPQQLRNSSRYIGTNVSASATESKKKAKQRCSKCDKKVGLAMAAIKCRCNGVFCAAHRLPEDHGCSFDYRTSGRLLLKAANPLIRAEKN